MTRVPTWNYVQAVLTGDMHIFLDEAQLADLVTAMSTNFEPQFGGDWQFNRNDPKELAQLRGIVGFELTVDTIQIKSKLSQNHPQTNRDSVASNLRNLNRPNALSLAQWMQNQISELQ